MTVSLYRAQAIHALYPNVVQTVGGEIALNIDNNEVTIDNALVDVKCAELAAQATLQWCKTEAKKRIAATDWALLFDAGLANQSAFVTYRAELRALITNPVAEPTWPTEPQPIWS